MPHLASQTTPPAAALSRPVPELLVVGRRDPASWPEPLAQWLKENRVCLQMAGNLFEAAEKMVREMGRWAAIVVDPEGLTRGEIKMLATIKRHVVLPIWSLPDIHSRTQRELPSLLPWDQATRALSHMVVKGDTPQQGQGNNEDSESVKEGPRVPSPAAAPSLPASHNHPPGGPGKRAEMPVTSQLAARYDEHADAPVLTDMEIQALLGPVDTKE